MKTLSLKSLLRTMSLLLEQRGGIRGAVGWLPTAPLQICVRVMALDCKGQTNSAVDQLGLELAFEEIR